MEIPFVIPKSIGNCATDVIGMKSPPSSINFFKSREAHQPNSAANVVGLIRLTIGGCKIRSQVGVFPRNRSAEIATFGRCKFRNAVDHRGKSASAGRIENHVEFIAQIFNLAERLDRKCKCRELSFRRAPDDTSLRSAYSPRCERRRCAAQQVHDARRWDPRRHLHANAKILCGGFQLRRCITRDFRRQE